MTIPENIEACKIKMTIQIFEKLNLYQIIWNEFFFLKKEAPLSQNIFTEQWKPLYTYMHAYTYTHTCFRTEGIPL